MEPVTYMRRDTGSQLNGGKGDDKLDRKEGKEQVGETRRRELIPGGTETEQESEHVA